MPKIKQFIKNFTDWFKLKPEIDQKPKRIQFSQRDVWATYLGTNIGFEIDGKKSQLLRPCLVYKNYPIKLPWLFQLLTQSKMAIGIALAVLKTRLVHIACIKLEWWMLKDLNTE